MSTYSAKTPQLTNFTEFRLSGAVAPGDTSITLTSVAGLPALPSPYDYIPMVLRDSGVNREIVHVTAVNTSTKVLTVVRGCEGTTAQSWTSTAYAYCDLTAESARDMLVNTWRRPIGGSGSAVIPVRTSNTTFTLAGDFTGMVVAGCALRIFQGGAPLTSVIYVDSATYSPGTGLTTVTITGSTLSASPALDLVECSAAPSESPRNTQIVDLGAGSVQPHDPTLDALAALSITADQMIYATGPDAFSATAMTSIARTLVAAASASAMRTVLGLGGAATLDVGTGVQGHSAILDTLASLSSVGNLSAIAGLASAADKVPYFSGDSIAGLADFTMFARTLTASLDASAARTVLGLVIGANVQAYDANTVKKNAVTGYTAQQYAVTNVRGSLGGAITVDADPNQDMEITVTSNATFGAPSNSAKGKYMVWTLYGASAYTLTFNAVYLRSKNNALPTALTANKRMFLSWRCYDGSNWILVGKDEEN